MPQSQVIGDDEVAGTPLMNVNQVSVGSVLGTDELVANGRENRVAFFFTEAALFFGV